MTYEEAGGSAFPITNEALGITYLGISARDYFAAKAMQGLLSNGNVAQKYIRESLVSDSYALADKMLEARK
jgi:hypothetical protein